MHPLRIYVYIFSLTNTCVLGFWVLTTLSPKHPTCRPSSLGEQASSGLHSHWIHSYLLSCFSSAEP